MSTTRRHAGKTLLAAALAAATFGITPHAFAQETIKVGVLQRLDIGVLPMQDPKLLLLDEPVAGMTDEEVERTAGLFLTLEGQRLLVVVDTT